MLACPTTIINTALEELLTMKALFKHMAKHTKLTLLCLSLLLIPNLSHARDVSFVWTGLPEPLTGYKLYRQEGENKVAPPIFLGKVTTHTVTGLSSDIKYSFYLTAYNDAGESANSATVTILPDSSPAPTIINISLK